MGLELEELTGRIIGAAIEVHRALGPGNETGSWPDELVTLTLGRFLTSSIPAFMR
jgi:hypothetical protein